MADSIRCEALAAPTFVVRLFCSTWRLWRGSILVDHCTVGDRFGFYVSLQNLRNFLHLGSRTYLVLLPANPDADSFTLLVLFFFHFFYYLQAGSVPCVVQGIAVPSHMSCILHN